VCRVLVWSVFQTSPCQCGGVGWWFDVVQCVVWMQRCLSSVCLAADHILSCARNNYSKGHKAVQDELPDVCTTSGQGLTMEVALPDSPDGLLRPADLLPSNFPVCAITGLDVTVAHVWRHLEQSSVTQARWRTFLRTK
jgi:hypothetical protein